MTKAVIADGDQLRTGPKWITARRGRLKVYPDRLECGDWRIEYSDIRYAVLSSFRSPILRIPGNVLAVRTDNTTFHFGLQGRQYWEGDLPFPVKRQQARLRMSPISVLARLVRQRYVVQMGDLGHTQPSQIHENPLPIFASLQPSAVVLVLVGYVAYAVWNWIRPS